MSYRSWNMICWWHFSRSGFHWWRLPSQKKQLVLIIVGLNRPQMRSAQEICDARLIGSWFFRCSACLNPVIDVEGQFVLITGYMKWVWCNCGISEIVNTFLTGRMKVSKSFGKNATFKVWWFLFFYSFIFQTIIFQYRSLHFVGVCCLVSSMNVCGYKWYFSLDGFVAKYNQVHFHSSFLRRCLFGLLWRPKRCWYDIWYDVLWIHSIVIDNRCCFIRLFCVNLCY